MEKHGVTTMNRAREALATRSIRDDLVLHAASYQPGKPGNQSAPSIMAGRGLDLSGTLDVYAWDILQHRVDELFHKVWHYFDHVLIVGAEARDYATEWEDAEHFNERILIFIRLILHLRHIGAERLVFFVQKPDVGTEEFTPETPFVRQAINNEAYLTWLMDRGTLSDVVQHGDHFHYRFDHPNMEHTTWGAVGGEASSFSSADLLRVVAKAVTARFAAHLSSDIRAAADTNSSLGIGVNFHTAMATSPPAPTAEQVFFHLRLPVVDGLSTATLLRLRDDERMHFEAFRTALRKAATEKLKVDASAEVIAKEIQTDILEPAILDLSRRLQAAERALARKAGLRVGVGALSTACGLLTGNPLLLATGLGTALSALGPVDSHADAKKDVELNDFYFLLKAQRLAQ
ncbi:hypothetical protein [Longimicrobium sp.]|uniref:hypothetical protein n=1 Tax=Longimicrobium sp. TaxID=2029185 RepID=UPI002EDA7052